MEAVFHNGAGRSQSQQAFDGLPRIERTFVAAEPEEERARDGDPPGDDQILDPQARRNVNPWPPIVTVSWSPLTHASVGPVISERRCPDQSIDQVPDR